MCFGPSTTGSSTSMSSYPPQLLDAANKNLGLSETLGLGPFNAPTQQIAGFSPDQTSAFGLTRSLAASGNPYLASIQNDYANYGGAPASKISAPSVLGPNANAATASLGDYLDPNIRTELDPTLAEIARQAQIAKTGAGGEGTAATAAGAFGDARSGVERAGIDEAQMRQAAQATAGAYENAFRNAANLRGIDISNLIGTQTTSAGLNEQALARALGAGNAFTNLDRYMTQRGLDLAQALDRTGAQQQQNQQQGLTSQFNQQMLSLLGPYQYQLPALNATLGAVTGAAPKTTTTTASAPNNSGWALGGALLGNMIVPGLGGVVGSGLGSALGGSVGAGGQTQDLAKLATGS